MTTKLMGIETIFGVRAAVFELTLGSSKKVYMRTDPAFLCDGQRRAVVVDADKFLALWRADPYEHHKDVSSGSPTTWPMDYKYHHPARHFAEGAQNPVPLAEVTCRISVTKHQPKSLLSNFFSLNRQPTQEMAFIRFDDGITRTIWLLSNGARSFPVLVDRSQFEVMHEICGTSTP